MNGLYDGIGYGSGDYESLKEGKYVFMLDDIKRTEKPTFEDKTVMEPALRYVFKELHTDAFLSIQVKASIHEKSANYGLLNALTDGEVPNPKTTDKEEYQSQMEKITGGLVGSFFRIPVVPSPDGKWNNCKDRTLIRPVSKEEVLKLKTEAQAALREEVLQEKAAADSFADDEIPF